MLLRHCPPVTFLLAGFGWLALSSVLGLAILIGLILGTPLPPWVRQVHVHAALVGGVTQMMLGGFLAMIPPPLTTGHAQRQAHPLTFLAINGGTAGMLVGFWLHHDTAVSAAGLLVGVACVWIARVAWARAIHSSPSTPSRWYYAVAFLALFGGIACGEALPFAFAQQSYGYVRLAHIHLGLLGFVTLVIVGMMHSTLPAVLNVSLSSPRAAHIVSIVMPLGTAVLIGGFMNSSVSIEIAAGGMLFAGGVLYAANLLRSWTASAHTGNAASDHLLVGTFFFLFTIVLGVLVGVNSLSNPPVIPYGTLHLVAYTHMALLGFIVNTAMGLLSHQIPLILSASRVSSNKKRGPYHERLTAIMDRWRAVQLGGLSLGTMGLGMLASLTWSVPLNSMSVRAATWICFGLLLSSLLVFSVKLATALADQPEERSSSPN
jgi:hypothetical protein